MKDNDFNFINEVTEYFYSTIDESNPKGNISRVMDKYKISRTKATKILITSGAIDSPLHQDIMKLKEEGYEIDEIASILDVSVTTVKTNMPYEKVIYGGEEKSAGAIYTEEFRVREKAFMDKVVKKPIEFEPVRETEKTVKVPLYDKYETNNKEDIINLDAVFTEEERKLFKLSPDIVLLHIELDREIEEKGLCGIRYGNTVSRDIIVPDILPLHNLHYVINQAFGFTNSHFHRYELSFDDLKWVTDNKISNYKKLIGLVFKNPDRNEYIDFWDDDYSKGSPRKWMRSKYTGPVYTRCYEESYRYISKETIRIKEKNINDLNQIEVNEALMINNIFKLFSEEKMSIKEWYEELNQSIKDAQKYPEETQGSQPWVPGFVSKLHYTYDYGDEWRFLITPMNNINYLLKDKRVSEKETRECIKKVCTLARPVILSADGYQLIDDCGGIDGYIDMLKDIEKGNKETIKWAKSSGWKKKIDKNAL